MRGAILPNALYVLVYMISIYHPVERQRRVMKRDGKELEGFDQERWEKNGEKNGKREREENAVIHAQLQGETRRKLNEQ